MTSQLGEISGKSCHVVNILHACGVGEGALPSLMAVGDLRKELESLQYREHRRVAVQGHITAVQYHRWPPEAPHTTPPSEQLVCTSRFYV